MKLTWQEAEELATEKSDWSCRRVAQCVFDAGGSTVSVQTMERKDKQKQLVNMSEEMELQAEHAKTL